MYSREKISILGCGWLGLPLAENFIKAGYLVQGSTTTPTKLSLLAEKKIKPFLIDLKSPTPEQELHSFLDTSYLIISFPPGIRAGKGQEYLEQILTLSELLRSAKVKNLLFISSTSVYPELNKEVSEAEDLTEYLPDNILLQAENLLQEIENINTTVLRLGGLVGGNRHPGRFLAGKQNVPNPHAPVNLIHLDDCVAIITAILEKQKWGEIYNACADAHPTRAEFYTAAAQKLQLPPPQFTLPKPQDSFKIISSEKIKKDLAYRFIHPDPMLFI